MITRFFTIASILFGLAGPVNAERWTLAQHGYWEVYAVDSGQRGLTCAVGNTAREGSFHLIVDENGFYQIVMYLYDAISDYREIDLELVLDGNGRGTEWTLYGARASDLGNGEVIVSFNLGYNPDHRAFTKDFMRQGRMRLIGRRGSLIAGWSLTGTTDAVVGLDACREKIAADRGLTRANSDRTGDVFQR